MLGKRLGELYLEPIGLCTDGQHLEDRTTGKAHPLEPIHQLAGMTPVAGVAHAANVQRAVGAPHEPVDAGLPPALEERRGSAGAGNATSQRR